MGSRYVLGWGAVLALAVGASGGTLVLVRQAIGDGNLADPLSQAQVRSDYAAAQHPTPTATGRPGASSTSTTANAPTTAPTGSSSHRPGSTTSSGGHTTGGPSPSTSTHPHPGGSGSSSSSHTSPPPSSVTRVLTSPGGSVVVRCTSGSGPGTVYLVSWSPAQGYAVNHAQRGPGEEAEIEFESDQSSVSIGYHCTPTGPVQEVETGDAWGGGGGDGSDAGGGGDG